MPSSPKTPMRALAAYATAFVIAAAANGQAINIDFGEPGSGPPATYGAAGAAGVWNSLRADHGTNTPNLLGLDGNPTAVRLSQIGGLDTPTVTDPATAGDDSLLMDDYLVSFDAGLESCIFLRDVAPGSYEVLVYAWMPNAPNVRSYTSVDQEPGFPHHQVGGAWPGGHQELVTYSRHLAVVGENGNLYLHSGIVPGHDPGLGAALNALQIRPADLFADGFESGDATAWSATLGE